MGGILTLSSNTITSNTTKTKGGGISLSNGSRPAISNNDIYGNTGVYGSDFYNGNASGGADVNAENNWWGTTDGNTIESLIWHFIDDSSLGVVDYTPYRTTARP